MNEQEIRKEMENIQKDISEKNTALQLLKYKIEEIEKKEKVKKLEKLADFLEKSVDVLVPNHNEGRYGKVCNDENLDGVDRKKHNRKDYDCIRCEILNFIDEVKRYGANYLVESEETFSIEIYVHKNGMTMEAY